MDDFLAEHVYSLVHWPFLAWIVISAIIGQVAKTAIWTKRRAYTKGKAQWLFWWAYKSLPLHPITIGACIGIAWQNPEGVAPAWAWPASVCYFAAAGALSVWAYEAIKGLAKKKGIDLGDLPGSNGSPTPEPVPGSPAPPPEGTTEPKEF